MTTDVSSLPPELQALIAAEISKALQANQPQAPRELTPAEHCERLLAVIPALERADHAVPSSSGPTHQAILDLLTLLVAAVYPKTHGGAVDGNGVTDA